MKWLIVDIETDSLDATKIWCAVTKEYPDGEEKVWIRPDEKDTSLFVSYLSRFHLVGHNILGFDAPVLNRFCKAGIDYRRCIDTLVLSRLSNSWNRSGHSLEAWGERLGFRKIVFDDFSKLSVEMIEYCKQDVRLTEKILDYMKLWWSKEKYAKSIRLEHDAAIICQELEDNGFEFDKVRAEELLEEIHSRLEKLIDEIHTDFKPVPIRVAEISPRATKKGTISRSDFRWIDGERTPEELGFSVEAPFTRFEWKEFNPGSPKQRIDVLNACGWKPVEKTDGHIKALREGTYEDKKDHWDTYGWKCNEENLKTLPKDAPEGARKLVEWIFLDSRRSTLVEWISLCRASADGCRVHGKFTHIQPWTHRMAHSGPNMANIPRVMKEKDFPNPSLVESLGILYNGQMRELWTVPPKKLLIGTDAEGIQLRILAHYLKNENYAKAIVDGKKENETDVHNVNKRALGLNHISRDDAKTFIYAWLLGAAAPKVSGILQTSVQNARIAMANFLKRIDGLERLKYGQIPSDAERGYFIGLDGRHVKCDSEHLMLAGYLQCGEAVVMKLANRIWRDRLRKEKIWFKQVNFVHDEWQTEVEDDLKLAEYVASVQRDSIRQAGEELDLFCRLDGSSVIGKNWKETH